MRYPVNAHHLILLLMFNMPLAALADTDADILVDYQREFSMLEETDNSVNVQLFADGMVQIHYPFFMRLAGNYQFQLNNNELDHIMQTLQQLGVSQLDPISTRQSIALEQSAALEAANFPGQSARIITDPETTRLSIAATANSNSNTFSISGVRTHAQLYPQITTLVDLSTALDMLDALTNDVRMQAIEVTQ